MEQGQAGSSRGAGGREGTEARGVGGPQDEAGTQQRPPLPVWERAAQRSTAAGGPEGPTEHQEQRTCMETWV